MGKNKKKFIDKKNASRYHLMHRSQRDVGGDIIEQEGTEIGDSGMILWPDPNNDPDTDRAVLLAEDEKNTMKEWRSKLAQVGLLDEYDEQYLKPITGTGTFLSAKGKEESTVKDPRTKLVTDELVAEVNQDFEGIPLAAECMDEDIEQALMGDFDDGDFEEIADDFVFDAAKEPEEGDDEAFNFDAHIAKLMEEARRQAEDDPTIPAGQHDWGAKDQDFFAQARPLHAVGEDEDSLFGGTTLEVTPGVVPALNPDEERALCEQFERALAEYDSDEEGGILEEEIYGDRPLEGDAQMEAALDDFLEERDGGFFMQGKAPEDTLAAKGGSGFSALVGTRMVPLKELDGTEVAATPDEPERPVAEVLKNAKKQIQYPPQEPPPEEIFIDGKSYYSLKERSLWDCESILSTYSNLDNNPVTIGASSRRKNKKKHQKIQLSSKTGLPVLEDPIDEEDDSDDDEYNGQTIISVNRGVPRKKQETPEEKKARKAQVKKERQVARIQKKATKEVYKEEFMNRTAQGTGDDVAGNSVFRYS